MSTTFRPETARDAVRTAAQKVGLRADDAEQLRPGLHLLPSEDVLAEVRPLDDLPELSREITACRWLNSAGLPAAEPVADVDQAFPAAGLPVAFWRRVRRDPAGSDDLGELLRQLHALPLPTELALPEHDVLGRLRPTLENAPIGEGDRAILLSRLRELRDQVDARLAAVATSGGSPVLVDVAHLAHGQPEWDLGAVATEHALGWWTDEQYRAFTDAYGFDVTGWHGFAAIEAVHRIKLITALLPDVADDASAAAEYETRMRSVRDGAATTWTPR